MEIEERKIDGEIFKINHKDKLFYKVLDYGRQLPEEMEELRKKGYMYQLSLFQ